MLVCAAMLGGIALLGLRLAGCPPQASAARLLLVAALFGIAGSIPPGLLFWRRARQARELRRQVEALLHTGHSQPDLKPSSDEMAALTASLEMATRRVRVMLEARQRESARLEAILGSMVEGVVAVDPLLRITFVNRAFGDMMGVALPAAPARRSCRRPATLPSWKCSRPCCPAARQYRSA